MGVARRSEQLLKLTKSFRSSNGSLEFFLVDLTGSIGVDGVETGLDGFFILLTDLDIVLLFDFLDEAKDLFP
jgi:hypothetical protein